MRLNVKVDLSVDVSITKECTSCHEVKPLDAFTKHPNGKFGRRSKCKVCESAYDKMKSAKYRAVNELLSLTELRELTPEKKCYKCKELLPSVEFYRSDSRKDGLDTRCQTCNGEHTSQHRKDNPEKYRGYSAKRRALNLGLFLEDISYEELVARDGEECGYCHATGIALDIEHIWPLKMEGWHEPRNLTLACKSCNYSKGATHPAIYVAREGHSPNQTVLLALTLEHELTRTPLKEVA